VTPAFSIALLIEDKSDKTWRGLRAILEKLLHRFEDDGFTVRAEILPRDVATRPIMNGNRWRSADPRDHASKVDLVKYLARKVSEAHGFALFHYDGDVAWIRKNESGSPEQFEREIRFKVHQVLANDGVPDSEIRRRLGRLLECVPFYSVEAWTYQATERAIQICEERYRGADAETFRAWSRDRATLDDEHKVKERTVLGGNHNDELGPHVPVRDVVDAGRSLAAFVASLLACSEFRGALAPWVLELGQ
jgi:hypothetical protein